MFAALERRHQRACVKKNRLQAHHWSREARSHHAVNSLETVVLVRGNKESGHGHVTCHDS